MNPIFALRKRRKLALLAISILVGVVCREPASANVGGCVSGWYLPAEEVSGLADVIVRGRVERVETMAWRDLIWTETELAVVEVWKGGPSPGTLLIRQAGGELGDRRDEAGPRSDFRPGDEWILALDPISGSDAFSVIGFIQGAFQVNGDQATRDYTGMRFVSPLPPGVLKGGETETFPLAELRRRLAAGTRALRDTPAASGIIPADGEQKDSGAVSIEKNSLANPVPGKEPAAAGSYENPAAADMDAACGSRCPLATVGMLGLAILGLAAMVIFAAGLPKRNR